MWGRRQTTSGVTGTTDLRPQGAAPEPNPSAVSLEPIVRSVEVRLVPELPPGITDCAIELAQTKYHKATYALFFKTGLHFSGKPPKRLALYWDARQIPGAESSMGKVAAQEDAGFVKFQSVVNLLGLPQQAVIDVAVAVGGGKPSQVATLTVTRAPFATGYQPRFVPIIFQALGRSGTTWFLHFLRENPAVFVQRTYPHEFYGARYWINGLQFLSSPVTSRLSPSYWNSDRTQRGALTPNLYYRSAPPALPLLPLLGAKYPRELALFAQRKIDAFYERLMEEDFRTASPGRRMEDVRFIGEKNLMFPELVQELYPSAPRIFLVRDIRDVICSSLAFNRKRGRTGFGRSTVQSDDDFLHLMCERFNRNYLRHQSLGEKSWLVRYEDLITDPIPTMSALLRFLDAPSDAATVEGMLQRASEPTGITESHRTSASSRSSLSRWRQDMTDAWQEVCAERCGNTLRSLGYAV